MKRIVILGDSLSMPRPNEGIEYEDTYPYLLSKMGYEVICRSKRANDTKIQTIEQNILDDVVYLKPNILIIHLGIVDCAPRLFSKFERKLLSLLPKIIRIPIINFFSKRRAFFTKIRQISYVNLKSYESNLEKLINRSKKIVEKIIIIKIKNTTNENDSRSFNFNKKIDKYNNVLDKLSKKYDGIFLIDPNNFEDGLLNDGIHINKNMHKYIASEVQKILLTKQ